MQDVSETSKPLQSGYHEMEALQKSILKESFLIRCKDLIESKSPLSISFFIEANNKFPNDPDFLYSEGIFHHLNLDYISAIDCYKKSISIFPTINSLENLAEALTSINRFDEAIETMSKSILIKQSNISSHIRLASILKKKGDTEKALFAINTALKLEPENPEALRILHFIIEAK